MDVAYLIASAVCYMRVQKEIQGQLGQGQTNGVLETPLVAPVTTKSKTEIQSGRNQNNYH